MKKIVVFTGSGVSAESGLKTFRDSGGLWEEYRIEDVATPEAWSRNPALVLEFYNKRRKQAIEAKPNPAHYAIAMLEEKYMVHVITQNIDDLHERAGSSRVLHLHGEIKKSRSTRDPALVYKISGWELRPGDTCEKGSQLRPHIVWFGEQVPNMGKAISIASGADIFILVGTSLNVYPAAGLTDHVPPSSLKYFIDPKPEAHYAWSDVEIIKETAGKGVPRLVEKLMKNK